MRRINKLSVNILAPCGSIAWGIGGVTSNNMSSRGYSKLKMKGEGSLNPHLIVASLSTPIAYIHFCKSVLMFYNN